MSKIPSKNLYVQSTLYFPHLMVHGQGWGPFLCPPNQAEDDELYRWTVPDTIDEEEPYANEETIDEEEPYANEEDDEEELYSTVQDGINVMILIPIFFRGRRGH